MKTLGVISSLLIAWNLSAQQVTMLIGMNTDTSWFQYSKPEFNSTVSDFSATPFGKGYVFASSRSDNLSVRYFSNDLNNPLLDMYYVGLTTSGFDKPVPFSTALNTRNKNEGTATFTSDRQTAIFTGNVDGRKSLTLLQAEQSNNQWSRIRQLPFCEPGFTYAHPGFAFADSVLFFVSDCPGGFGGMDIYYVRKSQAGWSEPINAGGKINSPSNELFPFCSSSGVLYFSSNKQGGSGGLDILAIVIADTAYSKADLLASPVNSEADDFGFYISPDNSEGFFSSNRGNAQSDDDIYFFHYKWQSVVSTDTIVPVELCYGFFEEATSNSKDTTLMKYIWNFSDGDVRYGCAFVKCFDTTGAYNIQLSVRDSSGGDVIISETDFRFVIEQPNYADVRAPDTIAQHKMFSIGTSLYGRKEYEVKSVYYDFGNGNCGTGNNLTHVYHQAGSYYLKIYLLVRNRETDTTESRCVVKKIVVI